jgi:hypothetical protein
VAFLSLPLKSNDTQERPLHRYHPRPSPRNGKTQRRRSAATRANRYRLPCGDESRLAVADRIDPHNVTFNVIPQGAAANARRE